MARLVSDLLFLLHNTVPAPRKRAATVESWMNALVASGMNPHDAAMAIDEASRKWKPSRR